MEQSNDVRPRLSVEQVRELSDYCLQNASELVQEARILFRKKRYARVFFLSLIAMEEMGKRDMLLKAILIGNNTKQWNKFYREFRSHKSKLSRTLEHSITINPDTAIRTPFEIIDKYLEEVVKANDDADLLDLAKQGSLYVDMLDGKPALPSQVLSQKHASEVLKFAEVNLEYHRRFKPTDGELEAQLTLKEKMKKGESFIDYWYRTHKNSEREKDS